MRTPLCFLLVLLPLALSAQRLRVGVVGGGDVSRDFAETFSPPTPFQAGYEQRSQVAGYVLGPSLQLQLSPRLSFEIDALFKPLRFTEATVLANGSRRSVSPATVVTWQFPMLLKYQLRQNPLSPFLLAGPSLRTAGNRNGTDPSSVGLTGGVGITLPLKALRLEPALRYTRWRPDPPGPSPARTRADQVEFLLGVTTAGSNSAWKPLHSRVTLGAVAGAALTDRFRHSGLERRFVAGPQIGWSVAGPFSLLVNPLYSPVGRNVTWEFPVLARYTAPAFPSSRLRTLLELGPTFRTPQEINASRLGRYGLAAGAGFALPAGSVRFSSVLRYSHWSPESNPGRSQVNRSQLHLLFGLSF